MNCKAVFNRNGEVGTMLRRSVLLKVWLFEQKCAFTWQSHTVLALSIFGVAGEMGMEWLEIQLH